MVLYQEKLRDYKEKLAFLRENDASTMASERGVYAGIEVYSLYMYKLTHVDHWYVIWLKRLWIATRQWQLIDIESACPRKTSHLPYKLLYLLPKQEHWRQNNTEWEKYKKTSRNCNIAAIAVHPHAIK